jgi:hypothetical protein
MLFLVPKEIMKTSMKTPVCVILAASVAMFSSCDKKSSEKEINAETTNEATEDLVESDTPLLPVKVGDYWKYQVSVEIPAGITSPGASGVETEMEKVRTYIGKVSLGNDLPDVDAFDVTVPGESLERELVEITDSAILLRGTAHPEILDSPAKWLDPPVPFVFAGMRAGNKMAELSVLAS